MGTSRLTILFEDPFWIGLYEREDDTGYAVCRIVFGAEPRDQEVYAYLLEHWRTLRFSPPRPADDRPDAPKSPKRRQREARQATRTGDYRHQGPTGPEAPAGAGETGPSRPHPASSGTRRRSGNSSCGRSAEKKSTEVIDLCAFLCPAGASARGLRRRQSLL